MVLRKEWVGKSFKCFCGNEYSLDKVKFDENNKFWCGRCMMEWTEFKINKILNERR